MSRSALALAVTTQVVQVAFRGAPGCATFGCTTAFKGYNFILFKVLSSAPKPALCAFRGFAEGTEPDKMKRYEDCMFDAWDTCYMTRCKGLDWNAKFPESADSPIPLRECAGFCRLQPAKIAASDEYRQNIRENAAQFAKFVALWVYIFDFD